MRKIIVICTLFISFQATAQKGSLGIKGGFGLTNVKSNGAKATSALKGSVGLEASFHAIKLNRTLYLTLMPDLMYLPSGYESTAMDVNVNYLNVSVPILLNIMEGDRRERYSLYIGAGPFIGYGLSGKFKPLGGSELDVKFGETVNDNRSRYNSGIVFKVGFKYNKLALNLEQFTGLKNLIPKDRITQGASIKSTGFYMTMTLDIL